MKMPTMGDTESASSTPTISPTLAPLNTDIAAPAPPVAAPDQVHQPVGADDAGDADEDGMQQRRSAPMGDDAGGDQGEVLRDRHADAAGDEHQEDSAERAHASEADTRLRTATPSGAGSGRRDEVRWIDGRPPKAA